MFVEDFNPSDLNNLNKNISIILRNYKKKIEESTMGAFEIIGGKKLKGEITPQGAKNEALQVINAVLLTEKEVIINNIPDIIDVNKLIDLLATLGVKIKKQKNFSILEVFNFLKFKKKYPTVEINCLLYTSPSPRDS